VGTLERPQVGDVGDNDDDGGVALFVSADGAGVLRVDIAAGVADNDFFDRCFQRARQRRHQLFALLDEVQRGAPRRARAEARQACEQLDQALDFGSGNG
jgi:hypothetical protein